MEFKATNQSLAQAGGDIVAGNQTVIHNYHSAPSKSSSIVVDTLLRKLQKEMEENSKVRDTIDELRSFYEHKASDGVIGLEAKLKKGARIHEIHNALENKEMFVKTLEKWAMYVSAQEIFAFLLGRAQVDYDAYVFTNIDILDQASINIEIRNRIIEPIVADCGASVFRVNHSIAQGMLYWLAEQCFVRWHK